MNAERAFLDTNVLVYAVSSGDLKKPTANDLVTRGGIVSVQVLNEFVAVARGKRPNTVE